MGVTLPAGDGDFREEGGVSARSDTNREGGLLFDDGLVKKANMAIRLRY